MTKSISPKDLKARLDAGEPLTVIDVREEWELEMSAVDFATHIPMNDIPERADEIPKEGTVVLMCKVGGRSSRVADYLQSMGWENLTNLEGGILKWAADVDPTLPKFYH